jgi:glycosyltransferase involved in cell wall biosynthesis
MTTSGGAERVAHEAARALDAPILASYVDQSVVPDDVEAVQLFDGPLARLMLDSHWFVEDVYEMLAWEAPPEVYEYDALLINKNAPPWAVFSEEQAVAWYAHHTLRSLHDRRPWLGSGLAQSAVNKLKRALYEPNVRADAWAANSDVTARRVRHWWRADPEVIYPPVDTASLSPDAAPTGDRYVTVGRLEGNKRVDEMLHAFGELPCRELIVAGDGRRRGALEGVAPDNAELIGHVSEGRKRGLLAGAKAFVFCGHKEDFGIAPVEAMAAGTPVIGVREGFTRHQIMDGLNGVLYDRGPGNLADAVRRFEAEGVEWPGSAIREYAGQFSAPRFRSEIRDLVARAEEEASYEPELETPARELVRA